MNESTRRKRANPETYGTKQCPGAGLARSTSNGRKTDPRVNFRLKRADVLLDRLSKEMHSGLVAKNREDLKQED